MIQPIDSQTVATYLLDHPDFFEKHASLLSELQIPSPLLGKAISLQERQIEVLREKYKGLELRVAEMVYLAKSNDALMQKLQKWVRSLLKVRNDESMPDKLIENLSSLFAIPHVTLRLWDVSGQYINEWYSHDVTEDIKAYANSLYAPFCGKNENILVSHWFMNPSEVQSVAVVPLRNDSAKTYGLLVLGGDETRFDAGMATDFLNEVGETSSVALSFLTDQQDA